MPNLFFADLVREATSTSGTGPLTLTGAVPGHRRFAEAVPPGASFHYAVTSNGYPDQWETGIGSLASDGRLQRDVVHASSSADTPVNFAAGLKTVALTVGSEWFDGQQVAVDDLALALAEKQPLSTGHADTAYGETADRVTVRRGSSWCNIPLGAVAHRRATGRFSIDGPVDHVSGSAEAVGIAMGGEAGLGLFHPETNTLAFATGGVERLRVDAQGRVGIGTNAPETHLSIWANDPILRLRQLAANATPYGIELVAGGLVDASFKSVLNTGEVRITAGRSAGWGGHLTFHTDTVERMRITSTGAILPGADNAQNFGSGALRMATIFAATGTINTSDAREKTWRGGLNDAELRAASRIVREIGVYQWNDAVEEKGPDKARLHVGVRAQAVWAIMADEGLVDPIDKDGKPGATPYAFLCWDRWGGNDENMAGDRFGVRVDQLALFIAAAQEQRLAALEFQP